MDAFIRSHLKRVLTIANAPMPRPADCLVVKQVAAGSLAAQAQVEPRDFVMSIDGGPPRADLIDLEADLAGKERRVEVYVRRSRERRTLVTSGIHPGLTLGRPIEAIREHGSTRATYFTDLRTTWEAREWPLLAQLAVADIDRNDPNTPALVFLAAAEWEQGRREHAMGMFAHYLSAFADGWTVDFAAIALLYCGLQHQREQNKERAIDALSRAHALEPLPRAAEALGRLTGQKPGEKKPTWLYQRFPVDYDLPTLSGARQRRSLGETLREMAPEKALLICALGAYRANGPYSDFLGRSLHYSVHFHPFVHGLHVITENSNRPERYAHVFELEHLMESRPFPFAVLREDGALRARLEAPLSPWVFALTAHGDVIYEGWLDGLDMWALCRALSVAAPSLAGQPSSFGKGGQDGLDPLAASPEDEWRLLAPSEQASAADDGLLDLDAPPEPPAQRPPARAPAPPPAQAVTAPAPVDDAWIVEVQCALARPDLTEDQAAQMLEMLERALASQPKHYDALVARGRLLEMFGRTTEATIAYNRAFAANGKRPDALVHKGELLLDQDKPSDAQECFESALRLRPDFARAHAGRGRCLCWLGREKEAFAAFDRALSLDGADASAWLGKGVALATASGIFGKTARLQEAVGCFEKALEKSPRLLVALFFRGLAHEKLGHQDAAKRDFRAFLARAPSHLVNQAAYARSRVGF